jgi:Zn-dependent protease
VIVVGMRFGVIEIGLASVLTAMVVQLNLTLMLLNLLPIPPLDGGRIAVSLLPHHLAWRFARLEPWGFPILLVLLFTGVLGALLVPLMIVFRFFLNVTFNL